MVHEVPVQVKSKMSDILSFIKYQTLDIEFLVI